jgi:starch synthase
LKDNGKPLFAIVSRLTWQKGLDLVLHTVKDLLNTGANFVILGTGEAMYEQEFENIRKMYPSQMAFYNGYSDELAHQIYAASDVFLMPSLFEPCGIGQLIALRYGTLPLVRMTGGLNDTVVPYFGNNEDIATGFGFYDYDVSALHNTIRWALTCFENPSLIRKLRQNALAQNNDWSRSANEYLDLYKSISL